MVRRRLAAPRGGPSGGSSGAPWVVVVVVGVVAVVALLVALGTHGRVNGTLSDEDFADELAHERTELWYSTFSRAGRKPTGEESKAFFARAKEAARRQIAAEKAAGRREEDLRREVRAKLAR
jgi:hypothetical protein